MKTPLTYQQSIAATLAKLGRSDILPAYVEACMRAEYGTLDHLSSRVFAGAVKRAVPDIDAMGRDMADDLAWSYGLVERRTA